MKILVPDFTIINCQNGLLVATYCKRSNLLTFQNKDTVLMWVWARLQVPNAVWISLNNDRFGPTQQQTIKQRI
jgi:hypothetical protein